ncbi:Holliday junction branch migration protein RuvA [Treponema sp. OMZ 840]|uniref:Holliday junction branch migration protein RuvA n=1 Tax=Treponema sp. OMZ 840 TaxID=244313 RepID=UPI003D8F9B8D
MFNSITGTVTFKFSQTLCIQTQGLEWELTVPLTSLDALGPVGETVKVYTWLYHREDSMKLFGFATANERSVFLDLMKVEGVGAKAAIRILSSINAGDLAAALDSEDIGKLEKIPGVGKKTAQKMMLTLKGKLNLEDSSNVSNGRIRENSYSPWSDVISALVNMGYDKSRCEQTVENLLHLLSSDTDFMAKNKVAQEEILFRRAIVELA